LKIQLLMIFIDGFIGLNPSMSELFAGF